MVFVQNDDGKIAVNETRYLTLCNEELKRHELYEEGMKIINVPEEATGAESSGYSWKGPVQTAGVVGDVVEIVNQKYRLIVARQKGQN